MSVALLAVFAARGSACDLCAVHMATDQTERRFGLGVAEQFTRFGTLQDNGEEIANPAGEYINSSITQVFGTYRVLPWLRLQLNLPIITRPFRRLTTAGIENGDESGVGDMSIMSSLGPYSYVDSDTVMHSTGLLGVKLPSGSPDRLKEELQEDNGAPTDDPWFPRGVKAAGREDGGGAQHVIGGVPSGVHGHDLALGTGSTDVIIGTQGFAGWRRFFGTAGVQYAIRTTGAFDYRYANDLLWYAGPGYFVLLNDDYSLGVQALASGESKGNDTLDHEPTDDTAITSVYMGPALRATWDDHFAAELGVDLPLLQNNSSVQIVPDYRIRANLSWRF